MREARTPTTDPIRWFAVARILIVAGGRRGRRFAAEMVGRGHAVRATTRTEAGRAAIEAVGAECWIGTPDRLATLRGALENVTIACWMLAGASGPPEDVEPLHSTRLEFFLGQAIDTTVRGLIYDAAPPGAASARAAPPSTDADMLAGGTRIARALAELNAIPLVVLGADSCDGDGDPEHADERWLVAAAAAVDALLAGS
jgi:nucleoside-diphosphate-sugar epimerase